MLRLQEITLAAAAIDWSGLPHRFLNPGELEALITIVRSVKPRVVVEIGVNEGRTAKAILREVAGVERYIGVDVMAGYVPSKSVQRGEVPAQPGHLAAGDHRFELMLRLRGSLDLAPADLPACDVVFVDGDHGRAAVLHDSSLAYAAVRYGGIVIWHDYHDTGTVDVRDVLHELADAGHPIVHVSQTWLAFERR